MIFTLVASSLAGCVSIRTIPGPPRTVLRDIESGRNVRVTDKRQHAVELAGAHAEGDSLVGVRSIASGERVALAFDDIDSIAVLEVDAGATTLLVVTSVTLAIALAAYLLRTALEGGT